MPPPGLTSAWQNVYGPSCRHKTTKSGQAGHELWLSDDRAPNLHYHSFFFCLFELLFSCLFSFFPFSKLPELCHKN